MGYLYTFLFRLATPFLLLRLLWRGRKQGAYRKRIKERFGFTPFTSYGPTLWIHAVSVGESLVAVPIVKAILNDFPYLKIVVTTTTPTGSERIQRLLKGKVLHSYMPYDLPGALTRFIKKVNPQCLILMETELWPNLLALCGQRKIPVFLANGRLSARSRNRYSKIKTLTQKMLNAIETVGVQGEKDAAHFKTIGAKPAQIQVLGNIKFDETKPELWREKASLWRQRFNQNRPTWIVGSSHEGEESILLDALLQVKQSTPNAFFIWVPRHPERFNEVYLKCKKINKATWLWTALETNGNCNEPVDIFIGNTMGQLMGWYGMSDVAFVGGSLIPIGGHNLLEPASFGLPVITGPHLFNFTDIEKALVKTGGLTLVEDANALADAVTTLLNNPILRQQKGHQCQTILNQNKGALAAHLACISPFIEKQFV